MKKILFSLISCVMLSFVCKAQTPSWAWAKKAGSPQYDYGRSVVCDNQGYVYICGGFGTGTVVFGTDTLINTNTNAYDVYITKYDGNGNVIWARKAGGSKDDFFNGITADSIGNIYVTGFFKSDSIAFGTTTLHNYNNTNYSDVFVVKYDSNGNVVWAKSAGGNYLDEAYGIDVDRNGNVYVTGQYTSTSITFGTYTLLGSNSFSSGFITKYDPSGNVLNSFKMASSCQGNAIDVDEKGYVNCAGLFLGNGVTFGSQSLIGNCLVSGCYNYFIVQYDAAFNARWAKTAGGTGNGQDAGYGVCHDTKGNVIVTGSFYGATMVCGTYTLQNNNGASFFGDDVFVVKYDSLGNVHWALRGGKNSYDTGYGVTTDKDDDIYLTGVADANSITFGSASLTASFWGGYVVKCSNFGSVQWIKPLYGEGKSITSGYGKSIYATGHFKLATATFDTYTLTNTYTNTMDIFVARIDSSVTLGNPTGINIHSYPGIIAKIYPNPFQSNSTLELNMYYEDTELRIYDMFGKLCKQQIVTSSKTIIDRQGLSEGIYLFRIVNKNELLSSGKMIIE